MSELQTVATTALEQFSEFEASLIEFRERYDGVVYDLTVPEQEKQARSDRHAIGKVIADLDRRHKDIKAPILEATRLVDGRRKEIKDALLGIQGKVKAQIEAHEKIEKDRQDEHLARMYGIRGQIEVAENPDISAETIGNILDDVRAIPIDDSWEEYKAEAALAKTETIEKLETLRAARQKYEAEKDELARLRAESDAREQAEREERIRAEAKAQAEREAQETIEAAERAKQNAEAKAAAAAEQAELDAETARAKAEQARIDAELRAAAQERQRIADEQALREESERQERIADEKRKAKQTHRKKIHGEAKAALIHKDCGLDDAGATSVVEAIRDGRIDHVSITY